MPDVTNHPAGNFCWADLPTPDPAGAKEFYGKLLGWTYEDSPPMGEEGHVYSTVLKEGKAVAGLSKSWSPDMPSFWNIYVCSDDVEATAAKVREAGGTVMMGPHDVEPSIGGMIVASDAEGAMFSVWQPKDHCGASLIDEPGAMTWWEANLRDIDKARQFYGAVFGWEARKEFEPMPDSEYWMVENGGQAIGGMMKMPGEWKDTPPHWMVYFAVEDVDKARERVTQLGGTAITECMDIPNNVGRFAVVKDPFGAVFTLFKPART